MSLLTVKLLASCLLLILASALCSEAASLKQPPYLQEFYLVHLRQPPKDWKLPITQLIKEQTSCKEIEDDFHLRTEPAYAFLCPINEVEFVLDSQFRPKNAKNYHNLAKLSYLVESVLDLQGNIVYPKSFTSRKLGLAEDEIFFEKFLSMILLLN